MEVDNEAAFENNSNPQSPAMSPRNKVQSDQRTLQLDIDNNVASNGSESSISGPRSSTTLPRSISRIDLALNLWKSLQQKIVRTPFNKTYLLLDGAKRIFDAITANQAIDPSPLETLVAEYFDKANTFTSPQSSFSLCMTLEQRDKKLTEYKIQLDNQLKVEGELLANGEALKDGLVNTNTKITEL
nr:hypothetical protein CFP56_68254 [Quercus suber]